MEFAFRQTWEGFHQLYQAESGDIKTDALNELLFSWKSKDAENLSYADILVGAVAFPSECLEVYSKILLEDWHGLHEQIVDTFNDERYAPAIDSIYCAALTKYEVRAYDTYYNLATKCIYALYEIGTEKALEKLGLLAENEAEEISQLAGEFAEDLGEKLGKSKN